MSQSAPLTSKSVQVRLQAVLRALRLSTVAKQYEAAARQAAETGQAYPDYLLALLEQELSQREANRRQRLIRQAKFPLLYTLDTYDFSLMPSLSKQKVLQLARGQFILNRENVVLVGEIGTGKTQPE